MALQLLHGTLTEVGKYLTTLGFELGNFGRKRQHVNQSEEKTEPAVGDCIINCYSSEAKESKLQRFGD